MRVAARWRSCGLALALACIACWALAQEAAPSIPFKADKPADLPGAQEWIVGALACMVLLAVLLMLARRFGSRWRWRAHRPSAVSVVERTQLTANSHMVVARYRDRELLLVVGPSFASCIRDEPIAGSARTSPPAEGGS
jgi:hypothetical protein